MSSTNLDARPPAEALVTRDSGAAWNDRQVALIARTVAKDASPEELHFFLNVASRYNLDPFQGEVWCVKTRGRNGGEGRIAIIVGEQGRLKIANRYDDYRGFRSDTVCENDRFMKLGEPKELPGVAGVFSYVEHSYGKPSERGEIQGAWCEVYRAGRPSVYFYAPLSEYAPDPAQVSEAGRKHIPWFSTESRMIEKCSISTAFRMAFNLAGIYGEEEMQHVQAGGEAPSVEDEIEWGEAEDTAERMRSLFTAANNAKPGSYPPAKIRLMLAGLSDEERYSLAANEIIPFIRATGGTVPEPGETVVGDDEVEVMPDEDGEPEPAEEGERVMPEVAEEGAAPEGDATIPGV